VHGYWPTDRGIVALETYTQQPCCGFGPGTMSFVAAEEREPDVNGQVKVPTGGQEKSPPLMGWSQVFVGRPPPLALASFMR